MTAIASGVRAACAEINSGRGAEGTSRAVSFHSCSNRARSAGSSTSMRCTAWSGSATAAPSSRTNRAEIRSTVDASNRSAAYSTTPTRPSPLSETYMPRSTLVVPVPTASGRARSAPKSVASRGVFCSTSMTWNNGWCACERAGLSRSTRYSNGTSWCAYAARSVSRTRSSSSANDGSPDVSVRSTRVLRKNPTRSSRASSVRPATGEPIGTSVPAPRRVSSAAKPACSTMNRLTPCARASASRSRCRAPSIEKFRVAPR